MVMVRVEQWQGLPSLAILKGKLEDCFTLVTFSSGLRPAGAGLAVCLS
jgi:hypothetical protein